VHCYTVTYRGHAFAVVRAAHEAEAIDLARQMILPQAASQSLSREQFAVHEPSNSEFSGWLERRSDYLLADGTSYILLGLVQ
jgi:hypothetical protein